MNTIELRSHVDQDEITENASSCMDYEFDGKTCTTIEYPDYPDEFDVGLIVGPSGSGKSTILKREFGAINEPQWESSQAIASHFNSHDEAIKKLCGVGLNSIPSWCRPYRALSSGEKHRADIACLIGDNAVVDEFTSVVNRDCAKSISTALEKYIRDEDLNNVVIASCHYDIIEWLQPDWVMDLLTQELLPRGCLQQRPEIELEIVPCKREIWHIFKDHHYLDQSLNNSCYCWMATWNNRLVGFASSISMPCGTIKERSWREHRTVVLPDYQGLGIGTALSDEIARLHVEQGIRYYSRTAHPKMGKHREDSPLWRATSKNLCKRDDIKKKIERGDDLFNNYVHDFERVCFSHEFIGESQ